MAGSFKTASQPALKHAVALLFNGDTAEDTEQTQLKYMNISVVT